MSDIHEDLKDQQNANLAIKTLIDLAKAGKITQDQVEIMKKKWQLLQDTISLTF